VAAFHPHKRGDLALGMGAADVVGGVDDVVVGADVTVNACGV